MDAAVSSMGGGAGRERQRDGCEIDVFACVCVLSGEVKKCGGEEGRKEGGRKVMIATVGKELESRTFLDFFSSFPHNMISCIFYII